MASLLFDTNALIYWTLPESPFNSEVSALIEHAIVESDKTYALSSTLNEAYYVLCSQYLNEKDARESIRDIAETFDLVDLTGIMVFDAIDSDEPDYEDGLVRATAESLQVDAIISYDKKAFTKSHITKMTALEALDFYANEGCG